MRISKNINDRPLSLCRSAFVQALCLGMISLSASVYAQFPAVVTGGGVGGGAGGGLGGGASTGALGLPGAAGIGAANATGALGLPATGGEARPANNAPGSSVIQLRTAPARGAVGEALPAAGTAADAKAAAPDAKNTGADAKAANDSKGAANETKSDAKNAKSDSKKMGPDGKPSADDSQQPAAEQVKDPFADDIEFQRFVRSATGQSLRLYGYELFANPAGFAPVQAAPVPSGYILGPGDEIVVLINGLTEFNERLTIDRDGRVLIPRVGPLNLAGVALKDAEKVMTAHIGKVFRNFTVSVTLGRLRSNEIFVVGQARKPGKHLISSLSSLINALFETGGPSANGTLRNIELRRAGKTIATLDMYAFLARGDNTADVKLLSGDIIYIPAAGDRAALLGTINAPAIYELKTGETVNTILGMSGGLPTLAAPQKAQLERVDANREIARYVEDFALDQKGLSLVLKAGDIVTVFQVSPQIANVVTLQGNVAAPLRYTFKPGMRVSDLLSDRRLLIPGSYWLQINQGTAAGNYSRPEVNLDYATIQRLDPIMLRTKVVAFDLAKAIAQDKTENLELLTGDIVTVYKPGDAGPETENSIAVTGEEVGGLKRLVWRKGYTVLSISERVKELLAEASRLRGIGIRSGATSPFSAVEVNFDYATISRRDPLTQKSLMLSFNLGKALVGASLDTPALSSRDVIAIYGPTEDGPETENSITLSGEAIGGTRRLVWREGFTFKDISQRVSEYLVETSRLKPARVKEAGTNLFSSAEVNFDYATIHRRDNITQRSNLFAFNIGKALAGDPKETVALKSRDVIAIYNPTDAGLDTENSVAIAGEVVGGVRRFVWRPGFTIKDIIPNSQWLIDNYSYWQRPSAKNLRNDINWDYAQVIRRVPETLGTKAITFNLGKAVLTSSAVDNIALEPGDQIALFTTAQLQVPVEKRTRIVTLSGEVKIPGQYQVAASETIASVIQRAGGLTSNSYLFGLEFRREAIRISQQESLDRLVGRIETQMLSEIQTRLQNVTGKEQGEAVQSSIQADQLRIANMRKLKASGRVALNLRPEKPVLPPVLLEDGDTINVPVIPAFVGAFGAVLNENAILWQPSMGVSDILKLAGLTTYADDSSTFIQRADGTVLQGNGGRWGFGGYASSSLMPGDTVVVPEKADRETFYSTFIRGAKDITQIFYQFGLGAAAVKTLRN